LKTRKPLSNLALGFSSAIFFAARRIRSFPISHIFLYPALYASLFSSTASGNCTKINFLFPKSFAFNAITALAVVAEPLKKSKIISFFSRSILSMYLIRFNGLG